MMYFNNMAIWSTGIIFWKTPPRRLPLGHAAPCQLWAHTAMSSVSACVPGVGGSLSPSQLRHWGFLTPAVSPPAGPLTHRAPRHAIVLLSLENVKLVPTSQWQQFANLISQSCFLLIQVSMEVPPPQRPPLSSVQLIKHHSIFYLNTFHYLKLLYLQIWLCTCLSPPTKYLSSMGARSLSSFCKVPGTKYVL